MPPAYTGGSTASPYTTAPVPYSLSSTGYGGGMPGPSQSSGTITALFQPQAGAGSASQDVIVVQSSSADWQSEFVPLGVCSDGLQDKETDTAVDVGPLVVYLGASLGTHYSVLSQQASQPIKLTVNPSASVQLAGATSETVGYSAQVIPVPITLSGTTLVNNAASILCGQMCSASTSLPAGFTCTSYTWTIGGSNAQSWSVGAIAIWRLEMGQHCGILKWQLDQLFWTAQRSYHDISHQ